MNVSYDLHIHSALSPCGDNDMTPNNIVNMAYVKGLDVIAITDHNSMLNLIPTAEVAKRKGILIVPGIEVTTREEVHVLCYFPTINEGMSFQDIIFNSLPNVKNNEDIFGQQLILDHEDNISGKVERMLLSSSGFTIEEIFQLVKEHNGVLVPAHIDRKSFSIVSTLGFIPNTIDIKTIEVFDLNVLENMKNTLSLEKYKIIKNSDAHYLVDINEAYYYFNLNSFTAKSVVEHLKGSG
ncbi:PHP domain-containing protein [Proteiniborus sp.]|uniref:PHP domain-containing protein n=1 Tax=Proteiniborus sp. TaxID=2079015 RepID=UPI00332799AD